MDREALLARVTELQQLMEKHRMDIVAIDGALQDCRYWLAVLESASEIEGTEVVQPPSTPEVPSLEVIEGGKGGDETDADLPSG